MTDYSAGAAGPQVQFEPKSHHLGHRDQETFDRIVIEKSPRWKESHLSGDEWRFSGHVVFYVKDVEVHRQSFSDIQSAVAWLPSLLAGGLSDKDEVWKAREAALAGRCDNPGCANPAEFIHHLKVRFIGNEAIKRPVHPGGEHRLFCARHKHRGDCGLDDADSNYVVEPLDLTTPR